HLLLPLPRTAPPTTRPSTPSLHDALPISVDLVDQFADTAVLLQDVAHGLGGFARACHAALGDLHGFMDQAADFPRRRSGALGQRPDFAGDHGEAAALFACPGSLDGGIERQDVGLEGDAVDHLDDVADLLAGRIHALDLLRRLVHDV